jgi:hypothetical protein
MPTPCCGWPFLDGICAGGAPDAIGTKMLLLAGILEIAVNALLIDVDESEDVAEVIVPVGKGTTVSRPLDGRAVFTVLETR